MIGILSYGIGNLTSIRSMLNSIGSEAVFIDKPVDIKNAKKLILPGVGSFDGGMQALNDSGLKDHLDEAVLEDKKPIIGICLGAQMMGHGSEEGDLPGLAWLNFECRKLKPIDDRPVPHMSWNNVISKSPDQILASSFEDQRFYFVHSYRMVERDPNIVLGQTDYGGAFTSAVSRDNIIGVQFHPEKSHKFGKELFSRFIAT